jgi:hypothetical protein
MKSDDAVNRDSIESEIGTERDVPRPHGAQRAGTETFEERSA